MKMYKIHHHARQLIQRLTEIRQRTGLQYIYDKRNEETAMNAFFADMRLQQSANCFDPSLAMSDFQPSSPDFQIVEGDVKDFEQLDRLFSEFIDMPPSDPRPNESSERLMNEKGLYTIGCDPIDEPLEIWPFMFPGSVDVGIQCVENVVPINTKRSQRTKATAGISTSDAGLDAGLGPIREKAFPCEYCSLSFARKHDLQRHERLHTGLKPYKCFGCGGEFKRSDARDRHWIKHPYCKEKDEAAVKNTAEGKKRERRRASRLLREQKST